MTNNFTRLGYITRTADAVKSDLKDWVGRKTTTFAKQTADIQNNLLDTATPVIMEVENLLADFANSYAPTYANDFMWEVLAQSLGLKYKDASQSSVTLLFTGNPGDYIPANTKVTGNFTTSDSVILGTTGTAYATAYSDTEGSYPANTITEILSSVPNGVTVTNPSASIEATSAMTNDELKLSAQRKLRNARISSYDYAILNLVELGVVDRLINFKLQDVNGVNCIEAVVGGGDVDEVANVLFNSFLVPTKLVSNPSDNDTSRTATATINFFNNPFEIKWTLPKEIKVQIKLTLTLKDAVINSEQFKISLQELIDEEINGRRCGTPLNKALLNSFVYEVITGMNIEGYKISTIVWEITDEATGQVMDWDKNDYLVGINFDTYTTLSSFNTTIYGV